MILEKSLYIEEKWYALAVFGRQEKAAQKELEKIGIEVFLPLRPIRRCWSDRIQELRVALFPGYMFVHLELNLESRVRMLRLRQVVDMVGRVKDDTQLYVRNIPDAQIESLRLLVSSEQELEPINKLVKGTEVKILRGPFKGAIGIVEKEPTGKRRIVVQVPLLGRGVRTELSADDLLSKAEMGISTLVA
ncbi:MAG: UpxY family transcription antiterminator [bacterium]|nr:UpxY family transcription antiterminator [bacterium]